MSAALSAQRKIKRVMIMSDELQAEVVDDGVVIDGPEETITEVVEADQDLANPTDNQQEKNGSDSPEMTTQEKHQKEVNKQHKKYREEERARIAVEKKLEANEARLAELEAQINVAPVIPDLPNAYDDDFESKIAARDEAVRKDTVWKQEQASITAESTRVAQEREQAQNQKVADTASKYTLRAQELKVSPDELRAAGELVGQSLGPDVTMEILGDEQGPLITTYLASNPTILDDLRHMSVGRATVHIENVIKPNLDVIQTKPSGAPDPTPQLRGSGIAPKESGPKGATYE